MTEQGELQKLQACIRDNFPRVNEEVKWVPAQRAVEHLYSRFNLEMPEGDDLPFNTLCHTLRVELEKRLEGSGHEQEEYEPTSGDDSPLTPSRDDSAWEE